MTIIPILKAYGGKIPHTNGEEIPPINLRKILADVEVNNNTTEIPPTRCQQCKSQSRLLFNDYVDYDRQILPSNQDGDSQ